MPAASLPLLLRGTGGPATPGDARSYTYRLVLADLGMSGLGTPIISDVLGTIGMPEGSALSWTDELNDSGSLEFSLPIDHADVTTANFAVGAREVHLYRDNGDGSGEVLVWAGRLWTADLDGWTVRFGAKGWYFTLGMREIREDKAYTTVQGGPWDQFTILQDLLDYTQGLTDGDLGITYGGDALSGTTRELVVCAEELRTVADVIDSLAEADDTGFDFAVLPDKTFMTYAGRRGSHVADLDGTDSIAGFSLQYDGASLANSVAGLSESDEDCPTPDLYEAVDATARSTYGLLHGHIDPRDPHDTALVAAQTDEELAAQKDPRVQPTVVITPLLGGPQVTDFNVGDSVSVNVSRGASGGFGYFSDEFRIITRTITVPAGAVPIETVALGLDRVTS